MMLWGRGLLIGGVIGVLLSAAPAFVLALLPPVYSDGFIGLVAALLSLSVTPLAVAFASAGAILLLLAVARRGRS